MARKKKRIDWEAYEQREGYFLDKNDAPVPPAIEIIKKPHPAHWIRAHPDIAFPAGGYYRCLVRDARGRRTGESYFPLLDDGALREAEKWRMPVKQIRFGLAVTKQGVVYLLALRRPNENLTVDSWGQSALECFEAAKSQWVRITADMNERRYIATARPSLIDEPAWPNMEPDAIRDHALSDFVIDSVDHPDIVELRGEDPDAA